MSKDIKPFTEEEFTKFRDYCYTIFGLHMVGDVLNSHSVIDGDQVVEQVRQAAATIEMMKPLFDACMMLGKLTHDNGVVADGFRSRELLLQIREASISYWDSQVKD